MAWAAAAVLGASWATARGLAWSSEQQSLAAFHAANQAAVAAVATTSSVAPPEVRPSAPPPAAPPSADPRDVDQREWDAGRIRGHAKAMARSGAAPLALLRIPRLGLEVPIHEGTDEWTLNRGLGHIKSTARPGEPGNVGIAGHRDGFFRALKDVAEGDVVELAIPGSVLRYRVERLSIVRPDAVEVLRPTPTPRLTLVTCYPFYFVGPAPQRFIVEARPD